MAGTITVGELLSDPSSSNKITIGTGTTLDLVSGAGSVIHPAPVGMDDVSGVARATSGLLFNGDTAAGNALDDYEEGSWTPNLAFNGSSTGVGYESAYHSGWYTKVGNKVTAGCWMIINNTGSATGGAQIVNLPFNTIDIQNRQVPVPCELLGVSYSGHPWAYMGRNNNKVTLRELSESGAGTDIDQSNCSSTAQFGICVTYIVN